MSKAEVDTLLGALEEVEQHLTLYFSIHGNERFGLGDKFEESRAALEASPAMKRLRELGSHFELTHARVQAERLSNLLHRSVALESEDLVAELDKLLDKISALRKQLEIQGDDLAINFVVGLEQKLLGGLRLDETPEAHARAERLRVIVAHLRTHGVQLVR